MQRVLSRNGYSYVEGNPVNFADPSGENPLVAAIVGLCANPATAIACIGAAAILGTIAVAWIWTNVALNPAVQNACQSAGHWLQERLQEANDNIDRWFEDAIRNADQHRGHPLNYPSPNHQLEPPRLPPGNPWPQPTPTQQPKPIVLDLGPGGNITGEVIPLINHYRGQAKVVAIEILAQDAQALRGTMALLNEIPDNFDVIHGNFNEPDVLSRNGYGCASVAFAIGPGPTGYTEVANAVRNLVCPGGSIYVVTELQSRFDTIVTGLQGQVEFLFQSPPQIGKRCISNPYGTGCVAGFSPGIIGFDSMHIDESENYVLWARKH